MLSRSLLPLLGLTSSSIAASLKFTFNATWGESTLVGATKQQFLINGQSPGPALNLNVGDSVELELINNTPYNTSIHFHGITQLRTPWSDGVPGVSQYPLVPGEKFTYKWTADEYGQYWYHSHFKGQVMDGFYGSITVQPSESEPRPFSLISNSSDDIAAMTAAEASPKVVMMADWLLESYDDLLEQEVASGYDITCPDAIIINGKGSVNCLGQDYYQSLALQNPKLTQLLNGSEYSAKGCVPLLPALQGPFPNDPSALKPSTFDVCTATYGEIEVISVDASAGWASINFVSAAGIDTLEVSIDNHTMYVYATDGAYIVPQPVQAIVVPNGNRYQAMIKLDQQAGNYSIRVASAASNKFDTGYAILSYAGATSKVDSVASISYSGVNTTANFRPFSDAKIVPFTPMAPGEASATFITALHQLGGSYIWSLSGAESYNLTTNEEITPLLFDPAQSVTNDNHLVIKTKNATWVDIILTNPGPLGPGHPIHKHSNKAFIIGQGIGVWNYSSVADAIVDLPGNFNLVNPPLRDGFTTPAAVGNATWMAIRYEVVNPGAFIMHCHIQTHLSGGMAMVMLDGTDAFPTVPESYLAIVPSSTSSSTATSTATSTGSGSATPASASATATGAAVAKKPMAVAIGAIALAAALV